MYFPHAFRKTFLAINGTPAAAGNPTTHSSLVGTAGTLGFYVPTSASNSTLVSVAATGGTGANSVKPFYLIQSSYYTNDKIGAHGGYKESIKSKLINPRYISRVIKVSAKTAVNQVVRVSASATVAINQTYRLRLDLKGSPALRFLNHQLYRTIDAYTGTSSAGNTWRDPLAVLLGWKDQINANPFLSQFIQARAYYIPSGTASSYAATTNSAATSVTTTGATLNFAAAPTAAAAGQKLVPTTSGSGIPANSFVVSATGTTVVIKFPTQAAAPTIATNNIGVKCYIDAYSSDSVPSAASAILIPGTTVTTGASVPGTPYTAGSSAYSIGDGSSQTTTNIDAHLEMTVAYVDTTFGNPTFTPSDKYELEPLYVYASVQDELSNTNLLTSFPQNTLAGTVTNPTNYLSSHGIEVQVPVQAQGSGETVLRELILSGRYSQNAYPDSKRVDSLRMREIEADPVLATITNRSALYDQYMIVHNVPRWNNPTGMFDNDQYVINIYITAGTAFSNVTDFFLASANLAQTGTASLSNLIALETY